ncbi:DUF5955 family protein [Streptomyces sp. TRM 70351]|uniref:DUF5955 family protein n=1 Tax=Streptomyces sp. TRM 70351 TaxID=3116552 RepID=UPI002E7AE6AB|nr:DUF5955 family protein [Streptomyces sp. TRM 70351]MEE1926893.1 DUF5955 family protein [Streptomyces sp. TRM 70351]
MRSGARATLSRAADPRVDGLRTAVLRLRGRLAAHPGRLAEPDRAAAEEQLAALAAMAASATVEVTELRRALLLTVGALGSVSALAEPLRDLRHAIGLFGPPPVRRSI